MTSSPGPDSFGHQRHQQRVAAGRNPDGMFAAAIRGQQLLALGDGRPENEVLALQHGIDGLTDLLADRRVLGLQVEQGDVDLVGLHGRIRHIRYSPDIAFQHQGQFIACHGCVSRAAPSREPPSMADMDTMHGMVAPRHERLPRIRIPVIAPIPKFYSDRSAYGRGASGSAASRTWPSPRRYFLPQAAHVAASSRNSNREAAQRHIQPIRRAGTPATRAKSATSAATTAPAATNAYRPTLWPQTMVLLAPNVAPCRTSVGRYSLFRTISLRGLMTLVKTIDGPQNTPSSNVTASYTETLF